jgi:transposase InsO family protein
MILSQEGVEMRKVILSMKEMKKYTVIKKVADGEKNKNRAAIELGITKRHLNRLIARYREFGKAAFVHGNRSRKPARTLPQETRLKILELYTTKYEGANFKHYKELLERNEGLTVSITTVTNILRSANIISPMAQRSTKRWHKAKLKDQQKKKEIKEKTQEAVEKKISPELAHPSRPRAKHFGELVQMDASTHHWLFGVETKQTLHAAIDDHSGMIVGAYFTPEETLEGYYHVLNQTLVDYGIPFKFFTDRRTVFEYESKVKKSIESDTFTQFGYACHQLGIEIETSSVPQKKGRVERLFGTLQSRLITELKVADIATIEAANEFLKSYLQIFNKQFGVGANYSTSVFETAPSAEQINLILGVRAKRKVNYGHHLRFQNHQYLPVDENGTPAYYKKGTEALMTIAFDGEIYISLEERLYLAKKLEKHELESPNFDTPVKKEPKKKYIPPMTHPWKKDSFERYLRKIGKTQEEWNMEHVA